jgi:hypothetical protein
MQIPSRVSLGGRRHRLEVSLLENELVARLDDAQSVSLVLPPSHFGTSLPERCCFGRCRARALSPTFCVCVCVWWDGVCGMMCGRGCAFAMECSVLAPELDVNAGPLVGAGFVGTMTLCVFNGVDLLPLAIRDGSPQAQSRYACRAGGRDASS